MKESSDGIVDYCDDVPKYSVDVFRHLIDFRKNPWHLKTFGWISASKACGYGSKRIADVDRHVAG